MSKPTITDSQIETLVQRIFKLRVQFRHDENDENETDANDSCGGVLSTLDGKNIVTGEWVMKRLREVVGDEKLINVTKISKLLNLSYTQVEVYSEKLIQNLESRQSPQEKFMVLDKSWLTDWGYIQTVIDSVVTDVNSNGVLKLSDVRLVNGLNMKVVCGLEYWVNMIRGYLEPEIRIDAVEKYTLYTDQYAKKITPVVQKVIEKLETPTTISTIDEFKLIPEGLRSSIIEELVQTQKVAGQLQANVFVPQSTDDDLIDWVKLNFSSNGYIAYDMMKHRGIHTPQEFIKKHLQDAILLPTGATSELIVLQADAAIEEYLSLDKIVNLMTMFPSIFTKPDIIALIPHLPSLHEMTPKPVILGETYVVSEGYLENCIDLLKEFIHKKVTVDLKTKKSGSFSGTGKNKAIEKLSENGVTIDEIKRELESSLPSLPSQLLTPVARKIRRSVTELYQTQLDSVFVDPNLITTEAQELDESEDGRRKAKDTESHEQQDKLAGQLWELWVSILLYHEGLKAVTDASLHQSLSKYLLKSHGKSFIQLLTSKLSQPKSPTTSEKLALSQEVQQALRVLEGGLKEKKTDKFVTLGQTILPLLIPEFEWASPISEKAKSDHLNQYINSLLSQLQTANSLALSVHLSVLLLLALHNLEIHASGKFVPGLILILESTLTSSDDSEQIEVLENVKQCMDVVLKNGQGQEKEMSELKENIAKLDNLRHCRAYGSALMQVTSYYGPQLPSETQQDLYNLIALSFFYILLHGHHTAKMADGKSDIFARNGNESDDHEWESLVDLVEWFQHSLSIQEPTQPREYLYRRIKNQRNEDIAEWEETRRLETTQRNEQLISQFRQIREDKLGIKVPDEVFNEEFKLWENLFLQLNQKVRIDGDQFAASSFSSWHSKHLERYLPETIYRPLSHSPSLLPQPLWKSLRMRISHSFRVLYRMIDQMSIPTQPGQTGLHQLRDLNVNETVVRMFIDAWLPFVLDTIGGGSVFCVEGAEESDVVDIKGNATISLDEKNPCCCAVEYKVPASEQLLSSGALDYFFFTSNDNSDEVVSEVSSVTVQTSCSQVSQSSSSVQTQVSTSTVTVSSSIGKTIAQASSTLSDVLSTPTKIVRSFSRIVRTPDTPKYTSKDSVCLGVLETKRGSDSYLTQGSVQSIIQLLTLQEKFASRSYVLRDSDTDKGDGKPPVVFGVASTGYRFQFYVAKDYTIEKSDVITLDTWDDLYQVIGIIRSLVIMCRK